MQARLSAFLVWALVAAGVVFWGLRLLAQPAPLPRHVQAIDTRVVASGDFARLFGTAQVAQSAAPVVAVAESSRFKLLGVLAPVARDAAHSPSEVGVALIAVDGKPARAYRVGAVIDGDNVLQSVRQRGAAIGPRDGATLVSLDLPPPAPAATGILPSAGAPATFTPAARPPTPTPLPAPGPPAPRFPGLAGGNPPAAGGPVTPPGVFPGGPGGAAGPSPTYVPGASPGLSPGYSPGMSPSRSPSGSPTAPELAASAARLDGAMQTQ